MRFILLFACFLCIHCAKAQGTSKVVQLMKEQEEAWNKGDIPGFMKHYWNSDSLKFISNKGVTYGWQQTLDNYLKSYPTKDQMGTLVFTFVEVTELSGTSVFVIGQWKLLKDKPAGGYFTLLWQLKAGQWVIVTDHTS